MLYRGQLLNKFKDPRQTGIIYHETLLFYDNNSGNPIFHKDLTVIISLSSSFSLSLYSSNPEP